jgi:hypothetical protein
VVTFTAQTRDATSCRHSADPDASGCSIPILMLASRSEAAPLSSRIGVARRPAFAVLFAPSVFIFVPFDAIALLMRRGVSPATEKMESSAVAKGVPLSSSAKRAPACRIAPKSASGICFSRIPTVVRSLIAQTEIAN